MWVTLSEHLSLRRGHLLPRLCGLLPCPTLLCQSEFVFCLVTKWIHKPQEPSLAYKPTLHGHCTGGHCTGRCTGTLHGTLHGGIAWTLHGALYGHCTGDTAQALHGHAARGLHGAMHGHWTGTVRALLHEGGCGGGARTLHGDTARGHCTGSGAHPLGTHLNRGLPVLVLPTGSFSRARRRTALEPLQSCRSSVFSFVQATRQINKPS